MFQKIVRGEKVLPVGLQVLRREALDISKPGRMTVVVFEF